MENSGNMNFNGRMAIDFNGIADRLSLLSLAFNLKEKELAERAGVSETSWSNYRSHAKGSESIPNHAAVSLRDSLGISTDWILTGDLTSIRDDAIRQKIIAAQRKLSPRRRA